MFTAMRLRSAHVLRDARHLAGLTQRELGALVGVTHTTIWQLENGQLMAVRPAVAIKLARWVTLPLDQLFAADGQKMSDPESKTETSAAPRMGRGAA